MAHPLFAKVLGVKSKQAGKKEGGLGEGIFARPRLEPVRLWRNPIFFRRCRISCQ